MKRILKTNIGAQAKFSRFYPLNLVTNKARILPAVLRIPLELIWCFKIRLHNPKLKVAAKLKNEVLKQEVFVNHGLARRR